MRILIVEDEHSLRDLIQLCLANYGCCDMADNGIEAIEAIEQAIAAGKPYDLVCMDVMMPRMDGLEALQTIRRMEFKRYKEGLPGLKVIMITAKDMAKDMATAFKAGCEAYITKPFSREKLIEQIHALGLMDVPDTDNAPIPDTSNDMIEL